MVDRPSGDWATEATLKKIADNTGKTVDSLNNLLRTKSRGLDSFNKDATTAGKLLKNNQEDFRKAVTNLQKDMISWRQGMKTVGHGMTEATTLFGLLGTAASNVLSGFTGFIKAIPGAGTALTVLSGTIGLGIGVVHGFISQISSSKDSLVDLVQSGIMFKGSLVEFTTSVGKAGLTTDEFSRIAQQSSLGIRAFGEAEFLNSTTRLSKVFGEFALNIYQGNEYFADYLETSRLAGSVYVGSLKDQEAAMAVTIRQQHEIAALTGKSITEQRREARARAETAQFRVMMAALPADERKRMDQAAATLQAGGMTQSMAEAAIMQERFRRTTLEYGRLQAVSPEIASGARAIINSPIEEMTTRLQEFAANFSRLTVDPSRMNQLLMMFGGSFDRTAELIGNMITVLNDINHVTPESTAALDKLRAGLTPFAKDTQAINDLQDAWKLLTTAINSELIGLINQNGGKQLLDWAKSLGDAVRSFTSADPGTRIQKALESFNLPSDSPLLKAAKQIDDARGFWETVEAAAKFIWTGLTEIFTWAWAGLGRTLSSWGDSFVDQLRQLIPSWMLGRIDPTEQQRQRGFQEQQQRQLQSMGLPIIPPPIPERPPINTGEREQQIRQMEERINVLTQQILDLQPRTITNTDREELQTLNRTLEEAVRQLRSIREQTQ
jgi:hypothetical protein